VIDLVVGNATHQMITVHISTDTQAVEASKADVSILIGGESVTRGLGSGGDPEPARKAAEFDQEKVARELAGCDVVFLCAGLGGGTGTGATPVVAKLARSMGILTICVVTMPFQFEGRHRASLASASLKQLQQECDLLIPVPSEGLVSRMAPGTPLADCFLELSGHQQSCW